MPRYIHVVQEACQQLPRFLACRRPALALDLGEARLDFLPPTADELASDAVVLWLDPSVAASHYQMPYKLTDAKGLYVEVRPSGSKLWRYRYRIDGKENG